MIGTSAEDMVLGKSVEVAKRKLKVGIKINRYWAELVVITLVLVLWAPRLSGPIDLRWDAGVYYVLGTSLATGQGYRIISEPGAPEALQYPPLLPAFVALHQRVLGSTDAAVVAPWLRISYALLFLIYALAALALARRYLRAGFALLAVALSLLQVNTLFFSDLLFAELPFALVSVLFVLIAVDGPLASRPWWREAVSFAVAAAGFLLRTAGIALLVAWVLEAAARRHWRLALTRGLLALLPILAWQAHVARVRGSYEYAHPAYEYQRAAYQFYNVSYAENVGLIDFSRTASRQMYSRAIAARLTNLLRLGKRLGEEISTSDYYWRQFLSKTQQWVFHRQVIPLSLVLLPIIALSSLVIIGFGVFVHRRSWLMAFILLASVGLICMSPWPEQFYRYLMPLTPFLAIAAMLAFFEIHAVLRNPGLASVISMAGKIGLTGLLVLALILEVFTASEIFYLRKHEGATFVSKSNVVGSHFFYHDPLWRGWERAIAWIEEHSAPSAIVATRYSHLCYLRTNRRAVSPPVESDPARARHLLETVPVSYVIVDLSNRLPVVETDSRNWRVVESSDGTKLYERTTRSSDR